MQQLPARPQRPQRPAPLALRLAAAVAAALALAWVLLGLNLDAGTASYTAANRAPDLAARLDVYINGSAADALGHLAHIKKIYALPRETTVAPAPNAACYGEVSADNAAAVLEVIEQARAYDLLDGQSVIFNTEVDFYQKAPIRYYCDETILVICWKEMIEGRVCTCIEVKIADGSQIRRKLTGDTYGSSERAYATALARSCNAVLALNADFYAFRDRGITVYQSQIYRFETSCDICFVDAKGDFSFLRRGQGITREAVEQYIAEHDVQFSLAFGPVLIENGQLQQCDSYPVGEIDQEYSRAGIGQYDTLHYLYMAVSHSDEVTPRATVNEFASYMYQKGLQNAYNLDGGQTGEAVFQNEPYNYIDFGSERLVSDILYFATAIPGEEGNP